MKMSSLQSVGRRQEVALIAALYFVGLVAVRGWVIDPQLGALKASQEYESAIDSYKDKSESVNSQLRAKRLWLERLLAQRGQLSDMVFTAAEAEEFLYDLETSCVEAGCIISLFRYLGETETASSIVTRTMSLTVHGEYHDVIKLIQRLKSRPQKVSIESLGMADISTNPPNVACRLVITIYVNLDQESGGNEDAQISQ